MMRIGSAAAAAAIVCVAPAMAQTPADTARGAVMAALTDSAAGWNAGDLGRFMAVYADAPTTTYVTGSGLAHGRSEIAAHYKPYFGGAKTAERGILSFALLDFRLLDPTHVLLIARYTVAPAGARKEAWSGPTSLVFEKRGEGWRIIADHSS
jgi:uncharacterized protein (TIGR02246 family)